ncbi:MAG: cytochrome c biogenesis protein [Deferrisomatales bacterium]
MGEVAYLWSLRLGGVLSIACGAAVFARRGPCRGLWLLPLGIGAAAAAWRTAQVGHLPLAGLHETLMTFGLCLVCAALIPCRRHAAWRLQGAAAAGAGVLWLLSSAANPRPTPLVPALQTLWFEVHVLSSFAAYACFALGAAAAAGILAGTPGPALRRILEGSNRWGFVWFSWGMVSGGIWAYLAWGTYWLWHVKELWSSIVWVYYAAVVHLGHLPGWRGRAQAAASLAGLGLVLFTYLGVGLLMRNSHQWQ